MTEGEAITPVQAQEAAPAAEPAAEQTKAAEPAPPAAETAPVPKPVEASGSDAVLLQSEEAPKKKEKKGFSLPKVGKNKLLPPSPRLSLWFGLGFKIFASKNQTLEKSISNQLAEF